MAQMRCTAAGDAMVFRRLPGAYPGFEELRQFLNRGDFRFLNLETTVHYFETCGAAQSGGSWFCAPPSVLTDAAAMGFNILSTANNHAMDYGRTGLEKTLGYIRQAGLPAAGTGRTLGEASAPVYLDTLSGRYALIAACSTFHPEDMAGGQTPVMPGRPGLNGIRVQTVYRLPPARLRQLREMAEEIQINARREIMRREGYLPPQPEGKAEFGDLLFEEAPDAGQITRPHPADMARMERSICEARYMADYVVVSIHSHEISGQSKEEPAQFLKEFSHRCIDAGAHAVIGTGPHLLRPVEIYKGCPIFYCLGDFIIQNETLERAPADMFEKQGLTGSEGLDKLFEARSEGGKKGLYYERKMFESVVPYWEAENGVLKKLELLPVELGFGQPRSTGGWPRPKADAGILERLAEMSAPYGTRIRIANGIGTVE